MNKKKGLHPKNKHQGRYNFPALMEDTPELKQYVKENPYGDLSIDFSRPEAVLTLNKALLSHDYKIKNWQIPAGHLCPPIPGRADYIHYLAEFVQGTNIKGIDIGTGASCIYPLLGASIYNWKFVASDINPESIQSAKSILAANPRLESMIECCIQSCADNIFINLINEGEQYDFTMCNPPFHSSLEEAAAGTRKKIQNLNLNKIKKGHRPLRDSKNSSELNFGGKQAELWCPGCEVAFINRMIEESKIFHNQCIWFTTLVSKKEHLTELNKTLARVKVKRIKTIAMNAGQKISHLLAWSFT